MTGMMPHSPPKYQNLYKACKSMISRLLFIKFPLPDLWNNNCFTLNGMGTKKA